MEIETEADVHALAVGVGIEADEAAVSGRYIGDEVRTLPIDPSKREADTRPQPPSVDRTAGREVVGAEDDRVTRPFSRVEISGVEFGIQRDIEITAGETGYAVATVTLWNLDSETWRSIARDDDVKVSLGWKDGDTETVFDGDVMIKRRRRRRGDKAHVIRCRSNGASVLSDTMQRSYNDMAPHHIVEDIVGFLPGISTGYIAWDTPRMENTFTVTRARDVKDWLDRLTAIAENQTGERYVWYLDDSHLYFHPRKERTSELITFDLEKSVLEAVPSGMATGKVHRDSIEVTSRCEPIIKRSLTCRLKNSNVVSENQLYRISKYYFDSSTRTGRHHTTMLWEPLDKTIDEVPGW